jgi:hypothetical protein
MGELTFALSFAPRRTRTATPPPRRPMRRFCRLQGYEKDRGEIRGALQGIPGWACAAGDPRRLANALGVIRAVVDPAERHRELGGDRGRGKRCNPRNPRNRPLSVRAPANAQIPPPPSAARLTAFGRRHAGALVNTTTFATGRGCFGTL